MRSHSRDCEGHRPATFAVSLGLRFGALSDSTRAKVLTAGPERLDVWAERGITGRSLEEILG